MLPSHATPIPGGGDGGGGTGGGGGGSAPITQPAATPGPAYPWEGSVGTTKTGNGNHLTSIPIVSFTQRGGSPIELTLNYNSQSSRNGELGPKWACNYDISETTDASGNVTIYWGDGRAYTFMKSSVSGTNLYFNSPTGIHDTLVGENYANGSIWYYTLTTHEQVSYSFMPTSSTSTVGWIEDENVNTINLSHNQAGNVTQIQDATNRTITIGYDANNRMISITDPLNRKWTLSYDANGNLAHISWPIINGTTYSINLGYDANHNIISYQDLRGNTSTFSYNAADNSIAWEKDNLGNQTSFLYGVDANGNANAMDTTIVDSNGHKMVHTYNSSGQLASVTDALGYTEYYSYDAANNVTQKEDRRGYYWAYTYDGMGNVLTATPPGGSATKMTYNAYNKPLTITAPSGRSIANTYDTEDNLIQAQQKNAAGTVLATTGYAIGNYGLVASKTDPNSHKTLYTYDHNGYLATVTTQLGHETQWTYDALGFQTERIDAMSRPTTYTPDAWERNVTTTYQDGTTNAYGYDANDNLTAFANYTGNWSRTYDADNRMTHEYIGSTLLVSHTYDATGQKGLLSTTTDTDGRVISYAYSARNELAGVGEAAGTETYAYDADGNQLHRYLPNGLRTDQYYNADGTLDSYYNWDGQSTIYQSYGYNYNADHQITGYNEGTSAAVDTSPNPNKIAYGYDALGHLTSDVRTGNYAYAKTYTVDGASNRLSMNENGSVTTLVHDADDELNSCSGTGTFGYTYNANGDQITSTINGAQTTYAYDFDDQLTGITKSGSTVSYKYDALGRQVQRIVNGATTAYYLDGDQILEEKSAAVGTVQYTWGNGLIRRGSEYPMTDGQGTTKLETNAAKAVTCTQETEAFGRSIGTTGSTSSPYGYHGGEGYRQDGDGPAGLEPYQKVGARYYDATFGRFITRDTDLTQAAYAYCDGDPVNFSDPSGHEGRSISDEGKAVAGAVGGLAGLAAGARFGRPVGVLVAVGVTYGVTKIWEYAPEIYKEFSNGNQKPYPSAPAGSPTYE